MRIAILGAGRIGLAHLATLQHQHDVSGLLIADLDPARAEAAAVGHEIAEPVTIDDAFSSNPDAIIVAAPTSVHAELVLRAVHAGIPVFCEKPLAQSLESTIEVVNEIERHDVPVQIGFQRRFDVGYRAAKAALEAGELGELRRLHLLTCDPTPPPEEFIPTSGGIYRDCHIHDFDILRWVTSREVESVFAMGANRGAAIFGESGDVDESVAILTLEDGTLATLHGSRYNGAGYDVRMELAGTRDTHVVGLDDRVPLTSAESGVSFPTGEPWPNFQERFADAYATELEAFMRVVRGEIASPCTPRDAGEALFIAEAADLSRHEGRQVRVNEVRR